MIELPYMKEEFGVDRDVAYLNHGALGLSPKCVWEAVHKWESEAEINPIDFYDRKLSARVRKVRSELGEFVGSDPNCIALIENATHGVNYVMQSFKLARGDEVLITDHEYDAYIRLWDRLEENWGVKVVRQHIPLPTEDEDQLLEHLWSGVTSKTKVIFFSHITSRTALVLPAGELCRRARKETIISVVDGAHVPGHIDLDLSLLDCDFYIANCHKWLFGPRPCGFLFARPEAQSLLRPLVVSYGDQSSDPAGVPFIDDLTWIGTRDFSRVLSIPDGIQFCETNNWNEVKESCRRLAESTQEKLCELFGFDPLYPIGSDLYGQMFSVRIPECDVHQLRQKLYQQYKIEVSTGQWHDMSLMRIGIQCYNSENDVDRLLDALKDIS